ncbi:endoribonuclease family protein [Clostridium sporogenes]|nr:endoribonuclease family protein [Clostridium sporogenes]
MIIEQKIKELGIKLPELSTPKAMYVPVKQLGNALFVSGQAPLLMENLLIQEKSVKKEH